MTEICRVYRNIREILKQINNDIEEEYFFSEEGCFFHNLEEVLNFTNINDEIEEFSLENENFRNNLEMD